MTAKDTTEEIAEETNDETNDETVEETVETTGQTAEGIADEVQEPHTISEPEGVGVPLGHEKPLFTGNLGGHVLRDSGTFDGGGLMGGAIGVPDNGTPGASQFAALQQKNFG